MLIMEELFCGSSNNYPISEFVPKSRPWNSVSLIGHIDKNLVILPAEIIKQVQQTFWENLCSEYDAENFCVFLEKACIPLSPEFKAFEYVWRRDELNHFLGFKYIYSIFYEMSFEAIDTELKNRPVDFNPLQSMLEDEFKICLLLAYDEISTTKSYASDYNFYASIGPEEFLKWIHLVARDEAYHFHNCMELIGKNYYHRISEIPKLVDQFVAWDLSRNEYKGTFVLDHESYNADFLQSCGDIMKKYFQKK
jgi:hypothetical protein